MNSEELELSLKAEFESYLSGVFAEMKQEVADFQSKIDGEFEKHRSQLDEAFKAFSAKFESERHVDKGFSESVVEHLRLARDDGAKLAATAFAEAEEMQRGIEAAPVSQSGFDGLLDAINDISSKTSQSSILKALTDHCSKFAPRGAFFIIRNEQFVGWRVMGTGSDDATSDIKFSFSSNTILHDAVTSCAAVESKFGEHVDDKVFLAPLNFGSPENMFAVPLVARGRGVAVLYADGGADNASFNKEALETLVRVASLTVELLAASQSAKPREEKAEQPAVAVKPSEPEYSSVPEAATAYEPTSDNEQPAVEAEPAEEIYQAEIVPEEIETPAEFESNEVPSFEGEVTEIQVEPETVSTDFAFASNDPSYDPAETHNEFQPVEHTNGDGHANSAEPVVETAAAEPARTPTRSWKVDLPIEVSEEEREDHVSARKFARLLVSEIKLYNEKQVKEGREANDLYGRLREAVDKSREMYEKRVKPPVASRFDYFHYELVNNLAEGDEARLGGGYPGSAV